MAGMTTRRWLQDLLHRSLSEERTAVEKEDSLEEFVNTSPGAKVPSSGLCDYLRLTSLPQVETDATAMSYMTLETLSPAHQLSLLGS